MAVASKADKAAKRPDKKRKDNGGKFGGSDGAPSKKPRTESAEAKQALPKQASNAGSTQDNKLTK